MSLEQSPINQLDKIGRLREQLKGRSDVFIAGEVIYKHNPPLRGFYEHVQIYVSPTELIGYAPRLRKFASSLTDLRAKMEGGYSYGDTLTVPTISLSEVIGIETRRMSRKLEIESTQVYDSYKEVEAKVKRGIIVMVYPHQEITKLVHAYKIGLQTGTVAESSKELNHLIREVSLEVIEQLKQAQDPFEELRWLLPL